MDDKNVKVFIKEMPLDCVYHICTYFYSFSDLKGLMLTFKGFYYYLISLKPDTTFIEFKLKNDQGPVETDHGFPYIQNIFFFVNEKESIRYFTNSLICLSNLKILKIILLSGGHFDNEEEVISLSRCCPKLERLKVRSVSNCLEFPQIDFDGIRLIELSLICHSSGKNITLSNLPITTRFIEVENFGVNLASDLDFSNHSSLESSKITNSNLLSILSSRAISASNFHKLRCLSLNNLIDTSNSKICEIVLDSFKISYNLYNRKMSFNLIDWKTVKVETKFDYSGSPDFFHEILSCNSIEQIRNMSLSLFDFDGLKTFNLQSFENLVYLDLCNMIGHIFPENMLDMKNQSHNSEIIVGNCPLLEEVRVNNCQFVLNLRRDLAELRNITIEEGSRKRVQRFVCIENLENLYHAKIQSLKLVYLSQLPFFLKVDLTKIPIRVLELVNCHCNLLKNDQRIKCRVLDGEKMFPFLEKLVLYSIRDVKTFNTQKGVPLFQEFRNLKHLKYYEHHFVSLDSVPNFGGLPKNVKGKLYRWKGIILWFLTKRFPEGKNYTGRGEIEHKIEFNDREGLILEWKNFIARLL